MEELKNTQEERPSRIKRTGHFIAHALNAFVRAYESGGMSILFPEYDPKNRSKQKGLNNDAEQN
jgi:hypothetical protein